MQLFYTGMLHSEILHFFTDVEIDSFQMKKCYFFLFLLKTIYCVYAVEPQ